MQNKSVHSVTPRLRHGVFALLAVVCTAVLGAPAANAAPAPILTHLDITLAGRLVVPAIGASGKVPTGGALSTSIDLRTGQFTSTVTVPDTTVTGLMLGFIPVTAILGFTQNSPLTGTTNQLGAVAADVNATLSVKALRAFGLLPLTSGECVAQSPVSLHLASGPGTHFSLLTADVLTSHFAIGTLVNCGALTSAVSSVLLSTNNSLAVSLTLKS